MPRQVRSYQECLDKSEATLKNREQFFAFLCHELRTPLSGIIGGVRLAEHFFESNDGVKRPEIGKMLTTISSSAQTMKQTVDEILDLSKLESDMFDINPADFNLRELADDIIGQHGSAAEGKGISLKIDWNLSDGLEKRFGDDHRIGQLLQNLLSNAIRFTDEGGVTVNIAGDDKRLRLQVKDTGDGMTQDQLDRLFSPFRQADGGISRRKGGSGLGMAILDRIVQAMSGRIEAQSEPGGGTSITLLLPVPNSRHQANKASEQTPLPTMVAAPLKERRLLIVEPNEASRALSVEILEGLGATVQAASEAEEAVAKALSPYVDSIVLDLGDSNIDGLEILKTCRESEEKSDLPKLHAVALLPTKGSEMAETARISGFNSYVLRPLNRSAIVEAFREPAPSQEKAG